MSSLTVSYPGRFVVFTVAGVAAPAGSKRAFPNRRTGGVIVTDDSKRSRPWKAAVSTAAADAMDGPMLDGPLELTITFYLPRPKSHFGSGRNASSVRGGAPAFPTVKPDVSKLIRAVEDAITGIVWRDDAQVIAQHAFKEYGLTARTEIEVRSLEAPVAS